jgi:hypothetical protein
MEVLNVHRSAPDVEAETHTNAVGVCWPLIPATAWPGVLLLYKLCVADWCHSPC